LAAAFARALAIAVSRERLACEKPDIGLGSRGRSPRLNLIHYRQTLGRGAENQIAPDNPRQRAQHRAQNLGKKHVVRPNRADAAYS